MDFLVLFGLFKRYKFWIMLVITAAAFAGGFIASRFLPADSYVEQSCEKLIKSQTGIDLDFTPDR